MALNTNPEICPSDIVHPIITMLSGDCYTLGPSKIVLDIKVRVCLQFEERFPPEVKVFDGKYVILEDQLPAPMCASVIFCDIDRSSGDFWKSSFEAFAEVGEIGRAGICFEEVVKYNPGYGADKLRYSSRNGQTNIARALVAIGVDVNAKGCYDYTTALYGAACAGHTDIVQMLVSNKADLNLSDDNGLTSLIRATMLGSTEIAQILVDGSADLNLSDHHFRWTPLIRAAMMGSTEVAQILADGGADLNCSCDRGMTPLIWATIEKNLEIVHILAKGDADLNCCDESGWTSLIWASAGGSTEIAQVLVRSSASVNTIFKDGETALSFASGRAGIDMISFLVTQKAALDTINKDGDTVVASALNDREMDKVTYLLSIGAPLGRTALVCAVFSRNLETVKFVLSLDNSLLKEERCGKTAHDVAVEQKLVHIIDVLELSEQ